MTPAARIVESRVEEHTLAWLRDLGYTTLFGPDIAPGEPKAERDTWQDTILTHRLAAAIVKLNPEDLFRLKKVKSILERKKKLAKEKKAGEKK